jgi:hypothetical protein
MISVPGADQDAMFAALDLVGRTGAARFQLGWLHDDVPAGEMGWYANAQYKGTRVSVEDQAGPVQAAVALAQRLLAGAQCTTCGGVITLSGMDAADRESPVMMVDGSTWGDAATASTCQWTRQGRRWQPACSTPGNDGGLAIMFGCPCCGRRSPNRVDIEHKYCGSCHWFTGDPLLGPTHPRASCAARSESVQIIASVLVRLRLISSSARAPGPAGQGGVAQ